MNYEIIIYQYASTNMNPIGLLLRKASNPARDSSFFYQAPKNQYRVETHLCSLDCLTFNMYRLHRTSFLGASTHLYDGVSDSRMVGNWLSFMVNFFKNHS